MPDAALFALVIVPGVLCYVVLRSMLWYGERMMRRRGHSEAEIATVLGGHARWLPLLCTFWLLTFVALLILFIDATLQVLEETA